MRTLSLFLCALIAAFIAMPALAMECANSGAVPSAAPDDTEDGNSLACGYFAQASGDDSLALGAATTSAGANSAAVGYGASSFGFSSIGLGFFASSSGNYSTALGYLATSSGYGSSALGISALASGASSTALGSQAYVSQDSSIVLGSIAGVNSALVYANVGIGTPAPAEAVDVERSAAAARFQLTSFTSTSSEAPQYIQRRARGTTTAPTAVQNNDNLGLFSFRGYNGSSMGGSRATITAQAAGNFSGSSTPTRLIFATTPVGQTAPQSVMVITPDGKVQVKGVNLNVPDYVFEDDYELMPLSELKDFIDQNGHLPGIASAQQVKDEGLDLAGSQMGLLQKVEELTLYTLQQQEQLAAQQGQLAEQWEHLKAQQQRTAELEALQERVAQLETQLTRALARLE